MNPQVPVAEASNDEVLVEASGLGRDFGSFVAVDDLSFRLRAGEVLSLLGPNGAGKTTTIRLLNGVLRRHRGSALVRGIDPDVDGTAVRRRTGVMTENAGLDDRLTALENVVFPAQIGGMRATAARQRGGELLEQFGMSARADSRAQGFSTGQRRRVALARALMHDPEVLFLDEPTSGLDPVATRDVLDLLHSLARDRGRAIVLCTHFLGEAGRLSDRLLVMQRGRALASGTPAELIQRLWKNVPVRFEVPADQGERAAEALAEGLGLPARPLVEGGTVTVEVSDRDAVAGLVSFLVNRDLHVLAVVPEERTLEDVYFAIAEGNTE